MNRIAFLAFYVAGIVAIWLSGNPWSRVNFLLLNPSSPAAPLTSSFFVSLLVPWALVLVAAFRGKSTRRPRLFLLPLLAILLSALAFAYGWLSRVLAGGPPSASGFLPMSFAIGLGLVAGLAPLVVHIICCAIGALEPKSPPARGRIAA